MPPLFVHGKLKLHIGRTSICSYDISDFRHSSAKALPAAQHKFQLSRIHESAFESGCNPECRIMEFVTDGHNTVHTQGLCQPGVKSLCANIQGAVLYQIHGIHDVLDLIILAIPLSKRIIVMLMPDEDDSVLLREIPDGFKVSAASVTGYNADHNIRLPD